MTDTTTTTTVASNYALQWPVGYGPGERFWCENPASRREPYTSTCPPPSNPPTTAAVPPSTAGTTPPTTDTPTTAVPTQRPGIPLAFTGSNSVDVLATGFGFVVLIAVIGGLIAGRRRYLSNVRLQRLADLHDPRPKYPHGYTDEDMRDGA